MSTSKLSKSTESVDTTLKPVELPTGKSVWCGTTPRNRWNMPETTPTEAGSRWEPRCQLETDTETGRQRLVDAGAENRYAKIQEQLEPTKIENILRRFQEGDASALSKAHGLYMDISEMPTSLLEAHKKIEEVRTSFENLPANIKEMFENDPMIMLAEIENGEGLAKLAKMANKPEKTEEVIKNEPEQ